jgi:hypothetical protein
LNPLISSLTIIQNLANAHLVNITLILTTKKQFTYHLIESHKEKEREENKEEIIKILDAGTIQLSRSPCSYPVLQVPKKNGT